MAIWSRLALALLLGVGAAGHGAMTKPVARSGMDANGKPIMNITNSGCTLPHEPVHNSDAHARSPCYSHMSWFCGTEASSTPCLTPASATPTLPEDMWSSPPGFLVQYHNNPWRAAGTSVPKSPCGIQMATCPECKDAKDLPKTEPREVWYKGKTATVGHSLAANHGGGYSWRLCPDTPGSLDDPQQAENCFQQHPLTFANEVHIIEWSNKTKKTIPAKQTTTGTTPTGSQWRRNPIPSLEFCGLSPCKCPRGWEGHLPGNACPAFEPPCEGCWGGVVDAQGGIGNSGHEDFSVLDSILVPDYPEGDYTLQWRWDTESLDYGQVWTNCADITIKTEPIVV